MQYKKITTITKNEIEEDINNKYHNSFDKLSGLDRSLRSLDIK